MANLDQPQPVLQRERIRLRVLTWRQQSQWFDVSYRVARERRGQIAIVILGVFLIAAIFADQIAPYHYETQLRGSRLLSPSWSHPFGTDEVSRDLLSRMIYGLRISLLVSLGAVAIGIADRRRHWLHRRLHRPMGRRDPDAAGRHDAGLSGDPRSTGDTDCAGNRYQGSGHHAGNRSDPDLRPAGARVRCCRRRSAIM